MASKAFSLPVTFVEHYTESYFRFRIQRPPGLIFVAGQFIMIGLTINEKLVMRAYSLANPSWDEELEFYSIIMPDGELTSRLKEIKVGDEVAMSARPVGSLVLSSLRSKGKRLFMLSTGTGVAPFASLIREEKTYRDFDEVYLTQTCRYATDLQYAEDRVREAKECPLVGEEAQKKLRLYSSVTREPYEYEGRITNLIESGKLFTDLGIPGLNPETDRIMICGSLAMLKDTQAILDAAGLSRGSGHVPGDYSWEKAFSG
jgi:ferredoxin--NADP+ reductase